MSGGKSAVLHRDAILVCHEPTLRSATIRQSCTQSFLCGDMLMRVRASTTSATARSGEIVSMWLFPADPPERNSAMIKSRHEHAVSSSCSIISTARNGVAFIPHSLKTTPWSTPVATSGCGPLNRQVEHRWVLHGAEPPHVSVNRIELRQ